MRAIDFPFHKTIEVTFQDLDAMGHVNNTVYLGYLETVRIEYLWTLFDLRQPADVPVILGEVTLRYLSPALFKERLTIGAGASRFGRKSFDLIHQIDAQDGRVIARASTTLIAYDYTTQQSIEIPAWLRDGMLAYQGGLTTAPWLTPRTGA